MARQTIRRKRYTIRKSKGNPNHCPVCGKFTSKKLKK